VDLDWAHNDEGWQQYNEISSEMEPSGLSRRRKDQRTGRGQLRGRWEAWNWTGAKRRAKHKIGRSDGVSSAACAPAGVERQRRRRKKKSYL